MAISLTKTGESHKINLSKSKKTEITVNLNWNSAIEVQGLFKKKKTSADLDLACLYKTKSGKVGAVQALGNLFGSKDDFPYIFLDGDDRTGNSQAGETMYFSKLDELEMAVIFAYIYEGKSNWEKTGAKITLSQTNQEDIVIDINKVAKPQRFCVIGTLGAKGDGVEVTRVEEFFTGHQEIDKKYNIGLQWTVGKK